MRNKIEEIIKKEYGKFDGDFVEPMRKIIDDFWHELENADIEDEIDVEEYIRETLDEIVCDGSNWFANLLMCDAEKCRALTWKCLWENGSLFYDTNELATETLKEAIFDILMADYNVVNEMEEILANNC